MRILIRIVSLFVIALAAQGSVAQEHVAESNMQISVSRNGNAIHIAVDMPVAADARHVWDVLTDYNHMASFFPNLQSSRAVATGPNRLLVEQTGVVSVGPFRFSFDSVRDIELFPYEEIRSRAVAGTIKSGYALTRLIQRDGITHVEYRSDSVPRISPPFGIGLGAVESRTRDQFESLRREIHRRMR